MDTFFSSGPINLYNSLFRLLVGLIAGGIIGINRERLNRAAGFRTHILISMGSCLIMLISIYIPQELMSFKGGDPGRIAAQVVTGIGFLGAGAIIKLGDHVKGLTTAASIWISAAIGMAIGAGMIWIALASTLLVVFTLVIMEKLERIIFKKTIIRSLFLELNQSNGDLTEVEKIFKKFKLKYEIAEFKQNISQGIVYIEINVAISSRFPMKEFVDRLSGISNLREMCFRNKP